VKRLESLPDVLVTRVMYQRSILNFQSYENPLSMEMDNSSEQDIDIGPVKLEL